MGIGKTLLNTWPLSTGLAPLSEECQTIIELGDQYVRMIDDINDSNISP
jgi:hypothetical protein